MIPSIFQLHDVLFDEDTCKRYLLEKDVFYHSLLCPGCKRDMERKLDRWTFRCPVGRCRRELSLQKHTFFEGSMLKTCNILYLGHLWLNRVSSSSARGITGFSQHTITDYYKHFRQLVSSTLEEEHRVIGGHGVIVEVDETKLGKRKYNRGHRVEGVWVVVGVERTAERRVFMVAVENRSAETLNEIIRQHVAEGSIIHTDLWKGYFSLTQETGLLHHTVNHSIGFIDNATGVHTNFVEGTNHALKRQIPIRCRVRKGVEEHLLEFVWRRRNECRLWDAFINAIKDIHYDME